MPADLPACNSMRTHCATAPSSLTHGRGLFADGLAFDLPGSDATPAAPRLLRLYSLRWPTTSTCTSPFPPLCATGRTPASNGKRRRHALHRLRTEIARPELRPRREAHPGGPQESALSQRCANSPIATCTCPLCACCATAPGRFEADPASSFRPASTSMPAPH